jgi:hypothetical protein
MIFSKGRILLGPTGYPREMKNKTMDMTPSVGVICQVPVHEAIHPYNFQSADMFGT